MNPFLRFVVDLVSLRSSALGIVAFLALVGVGASAAETKDPIASERKATAAPADPDRDDDEPIRYFERYKPSFFLLGKPNTKIQVSLKVRTLRDVPLYFGYSQLMMWDLFKTSAPFRDTNYDPEIFYRLNLERGATGSKDLDLGFFEHESNGVAFAQSRSWNRTYVRYSDSLLGTDRRIWWSAKVWIAYGMEETSRDLPRRRGNWELQLGGSDLFQRLFQVNELVFRIYGGGRSRSNPLQGGQEITYREKASARKFLLPLYLQIFHGYGENLLDADEKRWGLRAGIGF